MQFQDTILSSPLTKQCIAIAIGSTILIILLVSSYAFLGTNIVPALPKSIVNLTSLTSLNVSNNSLTQLPHDIDRLINLQYLDLAQWWKLIKMLIYSLSLYYLTLLLLLIPWSIISELRALPASVVRLQKLRVLDLCDNSLTELVFYFV